MAHSWLLLAAGLILLIAGADALVRGSVAFARRLGISPLIVGLTIVAFGTSAPELVVSMGGALQGRPGLAVGNVIGSNISNIALILAISAIISPVTIQAQVVKRDVPIMIGATFLVLVFLLNTYLSRLEGFVLFLGIVFYTAFSYLRARSATEEMIKEVLPEETTPPPAIGLPLALLFIAGGLVALVLGANLFVGGASQIARDMGVTETVIGLSIVAIGTSLPELATGVLASLRKASDVVAGNVVGSNIFNLLCILGLVAFTRPLPAVLSHVDLAAFAISALLVWIVMRTGHRVTKLEGFLLLTGYFTYLYFMYT